MHYPSIGESGGTEGFHLQISRGLVPGHRCIMVNGYNPDVDTSWENFWPQGGLIPVLAAAAVMTVSSTSADDTAAGTGVRSVIVSGLDDSFNEISEVVILNGQAGVSTTNSYRRINGFSVVTAGSGLTAAGTIYLGTGTVTTGVPSVMHELLADGYNNRATHSYTVPAGYTGFITYARFTLAQVVGSSLVWSRLGLVNSDGIKRFAATAVGNNGIVQLNVTCPIAVPEKTMMAGETMGSAANNVCSSLFQIVLVKNDT